MKLEVALLALILAGVIMIMGCSGATTATSEPSDTPHQESPAEPEPEPPEPPEPEEPEEPQEPEEPEEPEGPEGPAEPEPEPEPEQSAPETPSTPADPSGSQRAWLNTGSDYFTSRQSGCDVTRWQVNYLGDNPTRIGSDYAVLAVFETDFLPSPGGDDEIEDGTTGYSWRVRKVFFDDGEPIPWFQAYALFDVGDIVCLRMRVRGGSTFVMLDEHAITNLVIHTNTGTEHPAPNDGSSLEFDLPDDVYELLVVFEGAIASEADDRSSHWEASIWSACWDACIEAGQAGKGKHPRGYGERLVETDDALIYLSRVSGDVVEGTDAAFVFNIVANDPTKLDADSLPEVELRWHSKDTVRAANSDYVRYVDLEVDGTTEVSVPIADDSKPTFEEPISVELVQRSLTEAPVFYLVDTSRKWLSATVLDNEAAHIYNHTVKAYDEGVVDGPLITDERNIVWTRDAHPKSNGELYEFHIIGRMDKEYATLGLTENYPLMLNDSAENCWLTVDPAKAWSNVRDGYRITAGKLAMCVSKREWETAAVCGGPIPGLGAWHSGWGYLDRRRTAHMMRQNSWERFTDHFGFRFEDTSNYIAISWWNSPWTQPATDFLVFEASMTCS